MNLRDERGSLPPGRMPAHALLVIGGWLAASSWAAGASGDADADPAWPDNPLRGRLVFESHNCHQCHGVDREQGVGPALGDERFSGGFLDLGAALWNHVPGMGVRFESQGLPWPLVTPEEAVELTTFLYFIDYLGRPGDAEAGGRMFNQKGCSACHTIGSDGGAGPDLSQLDRFASPLYVAQAIWNHGPSMLESMQELQIQPPHFEEGDLADLSAFIRQTARAGPLERMLLAPGNPNRGHEIFESKGCSTCHAIGRGNRGGPDLAESDLHRSAEAIAGMMWNHALTMKASMRQRGVDWPHVTTTELADLIAYLYFLSFVDPPGDARRGEEVFATRSCADCHLGAAEGAPHAGPDLAAAQTSSSPAALVAAMWNHAPVMREAILGEGRPWPELTGRDLRDLHAYLREAPAAAGNAP